MKSQGHGAAADYSASLVILEFFALEGNGQATEGMVDQKATSIPRGDVYDIYSSAEDSAFLIGIDSTSLDTA
jgi:hypothetical protein